MTTFAIEPGAVADRLPATYARLAQLRFAHALWNKTLDVWTLDADVQRKIANRLGWLEAVAFVTPHIPRLRSFAEAVKADDFTDVVLLGMGGSSLAPEVMRQVLGVASGYPRFRMLDSVDPTAVQAALERAESSLFVLASKSGGTIEPNAMAAEARRRLEAAGIPWASRFVAITDEGTELHQRAQAEGFREIFVNPSDIGGRYSVLSFFGAVPAALMGVDLEAWLADARRMAEACRDETPATNPGLALGAVLAAAAAEGRDKLTLLVPERLASFGLWVEQLVAESTGKEGKGIVPITGESPDARYGRDRVGVAIQVGSDSPIQAAVERLRASGAPLVTIHVEDYEGLAGEFFRWEVATATAGVLLGINPFDEPNVQQAKDAARVRLEAFIREGALPRPPHDTVLAGAELTLTTAARAALDGEGPARLLRAVREGDYVGLLAYVPTLPGPLTDALADFRDRISLQCGCATMFGFGPRYLHSTGQLHKGGAPNGVFLIVTAEAAEDFPVPGEPFSFGVLEMAQALGDFASLEQTGRRALHIHLPTADAEDAQRVFGELLAD